MMKSILLAALLCSTACDVGSVEDDEVPELGEEKDPQANGAAAALPPLDCTTPPTFATTGTPVTLGGAPAWVHFNNPNDTVLETNLTDEAARLIWSVPTGGTIHAAIHSLSLPKISRALACAARDRGVTVKVVEDGGIATPRKDIAPAAKQLEDILAAQPNSSALTYCGQGTDKHFSCIQKTGKAIMHTKLFTFSTATAPDGVARQDVVWFGSANMTGATGEKTFNNTVTIYGDQPLYSAAVNYYRDLQGKKDVAGQDYFHHGGEITTASARLFLSPSPQTDLWYDRLDRVHAGTDCAIAVAHAYIMDARSVVVKKLRALANGGCTIKVIGALKPTKAEQEKQFPEDMLQIFDGDPANGVPRIETRLAKIHEKYMIIHARFGDSATVTDLVFTGSHNLTGPANSKNDELLARLDGTPVAAAYVQHFGDTWNAGIPAN